MRQFAFVVLIVLSNFTLAQSNTEESFTLGRFGKITVYRSVANPSQVVLFVSGDGGWNLGVVSMARALSSLNSVVVGINITHYLKELAASDEKCSYPAADFERLSKYVQKKYDFPNYVTPVLFGYSSGATLVYATLVQAPPQTFKGAISMGFCPDLPLTKPFCRGNGLEWKQGPKGKGYSFLPAKDLEIPWIVLQGTIDQVCDPSDVEKFAAEVPQSKLYLLPKVGHGFSVERNWMPQFKQAFSHFSEKSEAKVNPLSDDLEDLPLEQVPATGDSSNSMAIVVSGDGGWGVTDRGIANGLAVHGIPVIGLNSLHYFWKRRTPEGSALDLERILRHFLALWKKEKAILIGYSLGADVLPFMVNRLPRELSAKIQSVVMLGPSEYVDFEFHLSNWFSDGVRKSSLPIIPEIRTLKGMKLFCFYGEDDKEAVCTKLDSSFVKIIPFKGGHGIGKKYEPIVETILKQLK